MCAEIPSCSGNSLNSQRAFSLIEIIGVLAVIAILSALALPALTKQTDIAVANQESGVLRSFSDALQRSILRRDYIPGAAGLGPAGLDWVTNIANEVGLDPTEVMTNPRHQRRFFLIDPQLSIGGAGLPYRQQTNGTPQPVNARVILLSSLGSAFPNAMQDGANLDFNKIWNTPDGSVPVGVAALSGWLGTGDDLKIQRVDLSHLFVHLMLATVGSTANALYSINANLGAPLPPGASFDSYFLQNSVLGLYATGSTNLDSQQILTRDSFFVFYANGWRGSIPGNSSEAVTAFLSVQTSSVTNRLAVVQSFTNYFNTYIEWASDNFKKNSPYFDLAQTAYSNMLGAIATLQAGPLP